MSVREVTCLGAKDEWNLQISWRVTAIKASYYSTYCLMVVVYEKITTPREFAGQDRASLHLSMGTRLTCNSRGCLQLLCNKLYAEIPGINIEKIMWKVFMGSLTLKPAAFLRSLLQNG